jgi:hypothetical protein
MSRLATKLYLKDSTGKHRCAQCQRVFRPGEEPVVTAGGLVHGFHLRSPQIEPRHLSVNGDHRRPRLCKRGPRNRKRRCAPVLW